jgi:Ca2+:H+ antiporter
MIQVGDRRLPLLRSCSGGLNGKDQALLAVTLLLSVIILGTGRTTVLQGIVHLVIFAAFLFFAVVP